MFNSENYLDSALLESIKVKESTVKKYKKEILNFALALTQTFQNGNKILICGNGGSAADSLHIAGEFHGRLLKERAPLAAISLSSEVSSITAIGNDYSFDQIYSKQITALGKRDDILWIITTSGNSSNLLLAADAAKEQGMKVFVLSGKDGGKIIQKSDLSIVVYEGKNSPRIQESHVFLYHVIIELVENLMFSK